MRIASVSDIAAAFAAGAPAQRPDRGRPETPACLPPSSRPPSGATREGKIADLLAQHANVGCRYQGRAERGPHDRPPEGETFALHQIPSGILLRPQLA